MNCPCCLSIMECRSEIHKISPTKSRMDLHCWNISCRISLKDSFYAPCMQVITNDPFPWECVKYGFVVPVNKTFILIEGIYINNTTIGFVKNSFVIPDQFGGWGLIKKIDYVQLSSGNDMHIKFLQLADKFSKLIPFI